MIQLKSVVFLLLIIAASTQQIRSEGWTQKKGKGFFALDYRVLSGTKFHDASGTNITIPIFTDMALNLYGEYGFTDNLTVNLNFPIYKNLESDYPKDELGLYIDQNNSGI